MVELSRGPARWPTAFARPETPVATPSVAPALLGEGSRSATAPVRPAVRGRAGRRRRQRAARSDPARGRRAAARRDGLRRGLRLELVTLAAPPAQRAVAEDRAPWDLEIPQPPSLRRAAGPAAPLPPKAIVYSAGAATRACSPPGRWSGPVRPGSTRVWSSAPARGASFARWSPSLKFRRRLPVAGLMRRRIRAWRPAALLRGRLVPVPPDPVRVRIRGFDRRRRSPRRAGANHRARGRAVPRAAVGRPPGRQARAGRGSGPPRASTRLAYAAPPRRTRRRRLDHRRHAQRLR